VRFSLKTLPGAAYILAAVILFVTQTSPPAVNAKSAAAAGKKDDPGCRSCVSQAASLFATRKDSAALSLLREWTGKCPQNAQLHLLLSTILVRQPGQQQEAAAEAAKAIAAAPSSIPANLQYGLVLTAAGDNMLASKAFERVTELDPGSYEAWSSLSNLYSQLHEDDKASTAAQKAADLEPGTTNSRLRLVRNLQKAGKIPEAKTELKRLIANSEYGPEFMQQVGQEALNVGAYQEAVEALSRVVEAYPKSMSPLRMMAQAQLGNHDYQGVLQTTAKMMLIDKDSPEAHALNSLALIKLDRLPDAEKQLQPAASKQPEHALVLLAQGNLDFAKGEYEQAVDALRHSLDSDVSLSKSPDVCFTLAQAMEKQGVDTIGSLEYYKRSIANGLSGADADIAKQAIQRLQGQ
jgi:predicted Zn-dependent protease